MGDTRPEQIVSSLTSGGNEPQPWTYKMICSQLSTQPPNTVSSEVQHARGWERHGTRTQLSCVHLECACCSWPHSSRTMAWNCCMLDLKCSLEAHLLEHMIPRWWCYLGCLFQCRCQKWVTGGLWVFIVWLFSVLSFCFLIGEALPHFPTTMELSCHAFSMMNLGPSKPEAK